MTCTTAPKSVRVSTDFDPVEARFKAEVGLEGFIVQVRQQPTYTEDRRQCNNIIKSCNDADNTGQALRQRQAATPYMDSTAPMAVAPFNAGLEQDRP